MTYYEPVPFPLALPTELVTCPACGVQGEVCMEMAWHVERCVAGVRLSSRGALREAWERKKREEARRGPAR